MVWFLHVTKVIATSYARLKPMLGTNGLLQYAIDHDHNILRIHLNCIWSASFFTIKVHASIGIDVMHEHR